MNSKKKKKTRTKRDEEEEAEEVVVVEEEEDPNNKAALPTMNYLLLPIHSLPQTESPNHEDKREKREEEE